MLIVVDHLHPFTEAVFPDGRGLSRQVMCPATKQKWFEVWTWPPDSPDFNPIENLWDVLDKSDPCRAPLRILQDLKDLLLKSPQGCF